MGVRIRTATPADFPILEIIRRQAVEAAYADVYDRVLYADKVAKPDEHLATWVESEEHLTLVAESDITPVAYLVIDRTTGQLLHLYTSPDYVRRGYASELINKIESTLADSGVAKLWAWSPIPALEFFTKVGFTRTDRNRTIDGMEQRYVERPIAN